jgi:hypothetical protein
VWVADADCRCCTERLCCVLQVSLDLQPVEGVHRVTRSCCGTVVRAVATVSSAMGVHRSRLVLAALVRLSLAPSSRE